ncbi:MAG TPA: DUF1905 domain-containing protein [Bacteroidia bacterium]|nr:DUF1905 domain-containing protein [Bacteroidia bacterium]
MAKKKPKPQRPAAKKTKAQTAKGQKAKAPKSKVQKTRAQKTKTPVEKKKTNGEEGTIRFEGILEKRSKIGGGHYVRVPVEVTKFFGSPKGRLRVLGTMNGVAVDRALIPDGEGGHEIIVGTDVRKKTKSAEGQKVVIEIYRNPTPDDIVIPEELIVAIEMEEVAIRRFAKMTPGMKRNMAYWVNSGKLPETRAKRAVEILRRIMNNDMFGGRRLE